MCFSPTWLRSQESEETQGRGSLLRTHLDTGLTLVRVQTTHLGMQSCRCSRQRHDVLVCRDNMKL